MNALTAQVQEANILFIDQPVGTGYSYVESDDLFTNTTEEIAEDLYVCVKTFLAEVPEFEVGDSHNATINCNVMHNQRLKALKSREATH